MIAARLWRRVPVRGPGRLVLADLRRRARATPITVDGPGGIRLLVAPVNPPEVSVYLWGTYEPEVVTALERMLDSDDFAVDVGANCGVLTTYMASRVPSGRVLAIDPSAAACSRVEQQTALNGFQNVEIRRCAVGRYAGTVGFASGRVGIGALPAEDADLTEGAPTEVEVLPLDALLDRCDLVKIDTDGGEADVLWGARELLGNHAPALVFEVTNSGLCRRGAGLATLLELLAQHDYTLFEPALRQPRRWQAGPVGVDGYREARASEPRDGNYVALSPRSSSYERRRKRLLA